MYCEGQIELRTVTLALMCQKFSAKNLSRLARKDDVLVKIFWRAFSTINDEITTWKKSQLENWFELDDSFAWVATRVYIKGGNWDIIYV